MKRVGYILCGRIYGQVVYGRCARPHRARAGRWRKRDPHEQIRETQGQNPCAGLDCHRKSSTPDETIRRSVMLKILKMLSGRATTVVVGVSRRLFGAACHNQSVGPHMCWNNIWDDARQIVL